MKKPKTSTVKTRGTPGRQAGVADVKPLVDDLTCKDVYKCRRARKALVEMGEGSVPYLVDALNHRKGWVRWEAAKALRQIPGPVATDALVTALGDNNFDVRWLAAEGLIDRGREGLAPLMKALIEGSDSVVLREGAHHVLFDLSHGNLRQMVLPVLQALEDVEPSVEVPLKARALLGTIGRR
ncbi:MAG: HEAT repeat domain-containing protein [Dehalococcoidia bacterium]|nr:HEAT repeat domain-containing protein [Dehalococcoidia bacterium]